MLPGGDVVGHTEAACSEEPQQATAPLGAFLAGRRNERSLALKLVVSWDAVYLFFSAHDHCPNAYIASP